MFIVRSAFWLVTAFILVQPSAANLPRLELQKSAQDLMEYSLNTGRSVALDTLNNIECTSIECAGAKIITTATLSKTTPEVAPTTQHAPYPLPRLVR